MHERLNIYDRERMQCTGAGDPDTPLLVGGGALRCSLCKIKQLCEQQASLIDGELCWAGLRGNLSSHD